MCRYTKNQDATPSLGRNFMATIASGETVELTKSRLVSYQCANHRLIPYVVFQVDGRKLNGDECLSQFVRQSLLKRR
jgi:hypothetical protein